MTVCLLYNHAPLTEHSLYADAASRSADPEAELQTKVILYMDEADLQTASQNLPALPFFHNT